MSCSYEIDTRYLHQATSQPCTLRYVGPVATQTSGKRQDTWLGVEWDDPDRGKHSGTHLRTEYFKSRTEGAASFLKWKPNDAAASGKKRDTDGEMLWKGRTLMRAVIDRYLDTDPVETDTSSQSTGDPTLVLGSSNSRIQVTVPNLDKVTSKFANLDKLRHLGLDGMWVYGLGDGRGEHKAEDSLLDRLKCEIPRCTLCSRAVTCPFDASIASFPYC